MSDTRFPLEQVTSRLRADGIVAALEWHEEVGSTNAVALGAADAGAPAGLVVGAEVQTAGRGRRGRSWLAPAGSSLLFSVVLRPTLPPTSWTVLPLVAGLAVHDAAARVVGDVHVGLKWPNDLLVAGEKAAGILLESRGGAVVIGVGINVDWSTVTRPDGLVATSLAEHARRPVDRAGVLEVVLRRMAHWSGVAEADPAGIVGAYLPRCDTIGNRVVAIGVEGGRGVAVALTPEGHLRIRPDVGPDVVVSAGEVEHLR